MEVIFYTLNAVVITSVLGAVDIGGSMSIHMFGAYFGLTSTFFFKSRKAIKDEYDQCKGNYNSQLIAMIGTLFLFMFFPSFNAAMVVNGTA
jgi:ammonium transporter Rh